MNLDLALLLTQRILFFGLFLFGLEFYFISLSEPFLKIWSYRNLKIDLQTGLPLPSVLIQFFFADKTFKFLALLQIFCAVIGFFICSGPILIILFLIYLIMLLRQSSSCRYHH